MPRAMLAAFLYPMQISICRTQGSPAGELSPQVTEGLADLNLRKPLRPFGAPPLQGRQSGKFEFRLQILRILVMI